MVSVLYVDDEPDLLEIAKVFLEEEGLFQVDTAISASVALTMMESRDYSAIISDYQMPRMDGIQLLQHIRASGNDIPFLIFTGRGREEIVIQALNEGADFYIQKGGEANSQFAELQHKLKKAILQKTTEASLAKGRDQHRSILDTAMDGFLILDPSGRILEANETYSRMSGYSPGELLSMHISDLDARESGAETADHIQSIIASGEDRFESVHSRKDGSTYHIGASVQFRPVDGGQFIVFLYDISDRKHTERIYHLADRVNRIAIHASSLAEMLDGFVEEFQEFSGCEAVGIRILDTQGNIPYQAYRGFPADFYEKESPLNVKSDECMCIYVINGTISPDLPVATPGGSFYCNGTSRFLATISEEAKGNTRNVCNTMGYESVALIPIRSHAGILGLIQLNDTRENRVPLELVRVFEEISPLVGEMVRRMVAEENLRRANARFQASMEAGQLAWWEMDCRTGSVMFHENKTKMLGYTAESFVHYTDFTRLLHPDDHEPAMQAMRDHLSGVTSRYDIEYRIRDADGNYHWFRDVGGISSRDSEGTPRVVTGIVLDITSQKPMKPSVPECEEKAR